MENNGDSPSPEVRRTQQVDNAIRAIQEKKPVPEIDFSIHTMEDGTQVSTLERVCKGVLDTGTYPDKASPSPLPPLPRAALGSIPFP